MEIYILLKVVEIRKITLEYNYKLANHFYGIPFSVGGGILQKKIIIDERKLVLFHLVYLISHFQTLKTEDCPNSKMPLMIYFKKVRYTLSSRLNALKVVIIRSF